MERVPHGRRMEGILAFVPNEPTIGAHGIQISIPLRETRLDRRFIVLYNHKRSCLRVYVVLEGYPFFLGNVGSLHGI